MRRINKSIITFFVLVVFLIFFAATVFSVCPKLNYKPYELRFHIRSIMLGFSSNPPSYDIDDMKDLLNFYENEQVRELVEDCDVYVADDGSYGDSSVGGKMISDILGDSIVFQKECNDGKDNDGDGKIDLNDGGCSGSQDNDETDCGDGHCEPSVEGCLMPLYCPAECPCQTGFIIRSSTDEILTIDNDGNAVLKYPLEYNPNPTPIGGQDEFIFNDGSGNAVAIVNLEETGTERMTIKGTEHVGLVEWVEPDLMSKDYFVIRSSLGDVISYIDESGHFYIKGTLTVENP